MTLDGIGEPRPAQIFRDRAMTGDRRLAPAKQLLLYGFDEWEEFVEEWLGGLQEEYRRTERFGGSNDRGVDVAGFLTDRGFEGPWGRVGAMRMCVASSDNSALIAEASSGLLAIWNP